jgi:excisionase family DNA binding protein
MHARVDSRAFLTPQEVARELRVSVSSVYRGVQAGNVPAVRLTEHGALRIPRSFLRTTEGGQR